MHKYVFIVYDTELGWDSVTAVYEDDGSITYEDLLEAYPEGGTYVIEQKRIHTNIDKEVYE